jgi:hypothetical protein
MCIEGDAERKVSDGKLNQNLSLIFDIHPTERPRRIIIVIVVKLD